MSAGERFPQVITIRFDRIYGRIMCYPVDQHAHTIARLAGLKTLRPRDLESARELGFEVKVDAASAKLLEDFVAGRA